MVYITRLNLVRGLLVSYYLIACIPKSLSPVRGVGVSARVGDDTEAGLSAGTARVPYPRAFPGDSAGSMTRFGCMKFVAEPIGDLG